jgi:hypothetical protein
MLNSAKHDLSAHKDPVPRLLDTDGSETRFFQSIYARRNAFLFRDHFRMHMTRCTTCVSPLYLPRRSIAERIWQLCWTGSGGVHRAGIKRSSSRRLFLLYIAIAELAFTLLSRLCPTTSTCRGLYPPGLQRISPILIKPSQLLTAYMYLS